MLQSLALHLSLASHHEVVPDRSTPKSLQHGGSKDHGLAPRSYRQSLYRDRVISTSEMPSLRHIAISRFYLPSHDFPTEVPQASAFKQPSTSPTSAAKSMSLPAPGQKGLASTARAEKSLDGVSSSGPILFHQLDSAYTNAARRSADDLYEPRV